MKKLALIFGTLLFVTNAQAEEKELPRLKDSDVEFVNPIFYQQLEPISPEEGVTYVYPTFIDIRSPADKDEISAMGRCDLIENEQDHITLLCSIKYDSDEKPREPEYFTYTIKNLYTDDCLRIVETIKHPRWGEEGFSNFCVTPPDGWSETD